MESFSYRYELKRGEEVLATGHLSRDTPLAVGDRITVNGRKGSFAPSNHNWASANNEPSSNSSPTPIAPSRPRRPPRTPSQDALRAQAIAVTARTLLERSAVVANAKRLR
jgi:hypothetical protein